jgi:hypothetical protein
MKILIPSYMLGEVYLPLIVTPKRMGHSWGTYRGLTPPISPSGEVFGEKMRKVPRLVSLS